MFWQFLKHYDFRIFSDQENNTPSKPSIQTETMGKHIFREQNNSQVTKTGRYLAKYRPNFLGTQFACLRPGRSVTVSSPSDTGNWIIQSNVRVTRFLTWRVDVIPFSGLWHEGHHFLPCCWNFPSFSRKSCIYGTKNIPTSHQSFSVFQIINLIISLPLQPDIIVMPFCVLVTEAWNVGQGHKPPHGISRSWQDEQLV